MMRPVSSATEMNSTGGTLPRVGMLPSQQRLEAANPVLLQIENWLEVEAELPALQCLAQVELELAALARGGV